MAAFSTNLSYSAPRIGAIVRKLGSWLMNGLCQMAEASAMARSMDARAAQVERLNAKSDSDLAKMGLRRKDILHHVYQDLYAF